MGTVHLKVIEMRLSIIVLSILVCILHSAVAGPKPKPKKLLVETKSGKVDDHSKGKQLPKEKEQAVDGKDKPEVGKGMMMMPPWMFRGFPDYYDYSGKWSR